MAGTNDTWARETSPAALIRRLRKRLGARADRPLRFFALHAARLAAPAPDPHGRHALDTAELHLLGIATADQLADATARADAAWRELREVYEAYARDPATREDRVGCAARLGHSLAAFVAFRAAGGSWYGDLLAQVRDARAFQLLIRDPAGLKAFRADLCDLLREVAPHPSRPVSFRPEWRTETAVLLARQMLAANDFGAMPVLADALQDAGCDDERALAHCRDAAHAHLRGCWVLEAVLGG